MKKQTKIAFLGGDRRQHTAAVKLCGGVWDIYEWGHSQSEQYQGITLCEDISQALFEASAVILPLPASTDGINLNVITPHSQGKIALTLIVDSLDPECIIIGGRLPASLRECAASRKIKFFDYFESEEFQINNAYTTAEAAVSIAMDKLDKNIRESRFAITGYGRIAKQLARLLRAFDADVTVCARKESDLAWAGLSGCKTMRIDGENTLKALNNGYDVIMNTVPTCLFDREFLKMIDPHTLIIELASAPGGIDVSAAKSLHSNVLWAASLPGKYAPQSAGALIAECVGALLEREVGAT
ncbi:MAG: hypothetical protein J6L85_03950 [Clostridia bacterium]|nr:hypothetical protein [Clostridia bacterium]